MFARGRPSSSSSRSSSNTDWNATGRRRSRYPEGVKAIDFHDYETLKKFMTEQGKIMPSRITGATPAMQRRLARAIRRARVMGLVR
jgi:small subunit ribosomal protein S18